MVIFYAKDKWAPDEKFQNTNPKLQKNSNFRNFIVLNPF